MKPKIINLKSLLYNAIAIGILLFMVNMPIQSQVADNSKSASTNPPGVEYPWILVLNNMEAIL